MTDTVRWYVYHTSYFLEHHAQECLQIFIHSVCQLHNVVTTELILKKLMANTKNEQGPELISEFAKANNITASWWV